MKASVLSVFVVGALLAGFAPAQPAGQPASQPTRQPDGQPPQRTDAPPPGQRGPRERGQSIEGAMKSMDRAFQIIQENIAKPDGAEQVLAAINQMQAGAVAAKGQAPSASGTPEAVAAKKLMFRRGMIDLVKALIQLETDVLDGKSDAAAAGVKKIQALADEMHTKMGESDDNKGVAPLLSPSRGP